MNIKYSRFIDNKVKVIINAERIHNNMITSIFHTIGIIGYSHDPKVIKIYNILYHWLYHQGFTVMVENHIAYWLHLKHHTIISELTCIGDQADLAIVIGGDGSMLRAANTLSKYDIKVIGINVGTLGFLTDLYPHSALTELSDILSGNFINEKRFLLDVSDSAMKKLGNAINEVILYTSTIRQIIEFNLYINNNFAFSLRSDGLIIATPTGSTAYALSAGGPIINPEVDAIILIPICPHTLSYRPILINSNSIIAVQFSKITPKLQIRCDNQIPIVICCKEKKILIQRSNYYINLIHSNNYNYFNNLNVKLGWSKIIN